MRVLDRGGAARLWGVLSVVGCGLPVGRTEAPPPAVAPAAGCSGAGVEQVAGVFSMTYGDPPPGRERPRTDFTLALANGTTIVLLIDDDLLGPHDAGRALHGHRVAVAGQGVRAARRTLRVCAITPF